ncbi:Detected protein of unknown function [Hibiscus syriacus]|uniref:Uncharacterized protein n=1 Tax=Hibiscus syriacus TaxID=106335 RepID=A0A6A3A959_HIBSY|nr:Detected protein of unknown function [Hibiscus syriacus]
MAAAEVRAVWQRTANRFFVQEDAKRAPKLACCQTSSSSKQADSSPIGVAGAHDQPAVGFMPLNRIAYYPNPASDMRDGVESLKSEVNSRSDVSRVQPEDAPDASGAVRKRNCEYSDSAETMKNCGFSETEAIEYKDELASLVAKKSLDFIENCDLPPPQKMHIRRYSHERSACFNGDEVSSSVGSPKQTLSPVQSVMQMRNASNSSFCTTEKDFMEQVTESDPTKAQLLEALRHSQTRAREAEKVVKQAYAEKEHVIKLIFNKPHKSIPINSGSNAAARCLSSDQEQRASSLHIQKQLPITEELAEDRKR